MLTHAEIVVRAPNSYFGLNPVIIGAGKKAAAPLEIGEDAITALGTKFVEPVFEEGFVVHCRHHFLNAPRAAPFPAKVVARLSGLARPPKGTKPGRRLRRSSFPAGPQSRRRRSRHIARGASSSPRSATGYPAVVRRSYPARRCSRSRCRQCAVGGRSARSTSTSGYPTCARAQRSRRWSQRFLTRGHRTANGSRGNASRSGASENSWSSRRARDYPPTASLVR